MNEPGRVEAPGAARERRAPKFSIVTPSLNQGEWIRDNILSVLRQDYPDFEHLIIDGGSTDDTAAIVAEYPHVRFVSEPDIGQSHAINKGILMATGDIVAYLNSDDLYRPGAFALVAKMMSEDADVQVVVGACELRDGSGNSLGELAPRVDSHGSMLRYWGWDRWYCVPQPSVFWRRSLHAEVGLFDVDRHYTMDFDMWLRISKRYPFAATPATLSVFRLHDRCKTMADAPRMYVEHRATARRYWPPVWSPRRWYLEVASSRHLSRDLLDVAEHAALNQRLGGKAVRLACAAIRAWPTACLNPRVAFVGSRVCPARDDAVSPDCAGTMPRGAAGVA